MTTGITQPLRLSKSSDFQTESDIDLKDASIKQAVMTRGSGEGIMGEVPWNPFLGSLVPTLPHRSQNRDLIEAEAVRMTSDTVAAFIPDVTITKVDVKEEQLERGLLLTMDISRSFRGTLKQLQVELK